MNQPPSCSRAPPSPPRKNEPGFAGPIHVLPIARGRQKQSLFDRIVEERAEGIVFKHARAPYKAGRGSTQLKYKLTKSADVVILSNAGNAYQMAVYDGKTLRDVGKVFAGFLPVVDQLAQCVSLGRR